MQEYKIDDVIQAIESKELLNRMTEDVDLLNVALTYCTTEAKTLAAKIRSFNDAKKDLCMEQIISIYPISANVIQELVLTGDTVYPVDQLFKWLDVGDTMLDCFTLFKNKMRNAEKEAKDEKSDYEDFLNNYNKELEKLKAEREEYKKNMKSRNERHLELEELRKEVAALREEWSEEEIEKKMINLAYEKKKLEASRTEAEKRLKKIQKELDPASNSNANSDYTNAFNEFSKIMKAMPEDESEI